MLSINNLYKDYGKFRALDGLNLTVEKGAVFGFIGPNGAGKTTAMRIICGLLGFSKGEVIINGVDISKKPKAIRDEIGYMPDFFGVYDNLKVDEYMEFYCDAHYIPKNDKETIINNLLEIVNLSDKKTTYVDSLSRGMKQRLCLARSLVGDPSLLILDEPASGLDPRARVEMKEILKQLSSFGKTIIISSHILSELSEMCTQIGIINKGKIVAEGSVEDITKKIAHVNAYSIKDLKENNEDREKLITIIKENPFVGKIIENADDIEFDFSGTKKDISGLIKNIVMADISLTSIKEKESNLEELFMTLTEEMD